MTVGRIRTPWIHSPNHPPPPLKHTELSPGVALWNWLCFQGGKGHSYVLFISPPTSYPLSVSSLSRQKKTKSCCRAAALLSWRLLNVCVLPLVRVCVFLCTCHTIMVAVSKPGWLTVSCLDWCLTNSLTNSSTVFVGYRSFSRSPAAVHPCQIERFTSLA